MSVALIFSGGGARGAYQLGVWKAMNELGITSLITDVYGTSVGAINGAAYVQGDYEMAEEIWRNVSYEKVFAQAEEYQNENYMAFLKTTIQDGGIDVSPLKSILRNNLEEDIIREDHKTFGMVVYNITNRTPLYRTSDEIPEGHLIEYVIASSTFPIFQPHRIDEELYLDGGIYDNRPFYFLNDRDDIEHIICIDVTIARYLWKNKKPAKSDAHITYIRPTRLLGSPLAFDNTRIQSNILLGYEDGMRQLSESALLHPYLGG